MEGQKDGWMEGWRDGGMEGRRCYEKGIGLSAVCEKKQIIKGDQRGSNPCSLMEEPISPLTVPTRPAWRSTFYLCMPFSYSLARTYVPVTSVNKGFASCNRGEGKVKGQKEG